MVEEVATEGEFYSSISGGIEKTLDDKITEYENDFKNYYNYILGAGCDEILDSDIAAEFVVHLVTRNDHFRRSMTVAAEELFGGFNARLSEEQAARRLLGISRDRPGHQFLEALKKGLDERPELVERIGIDRAQLEKILIDKVVNDFSGFHADLVGPLNEAFAGVSTELSQIGASAQRESLSNELVPHLRIERMARREWVVIQSKRKLVLPDCVGICFVTGGHKIPLMFADDENIECILLPVSSDKLLIGRMSGHKYKVDTNYVNKHLIQCSWDMFITDIDVIITSNIQRKIRTNVTEFIESFLKKSMEHSQI